MATSTRLVGVTGEEPQLVPSGGYIASQFVQAPSGRAGFLDRPFAAAAGERNVTIRTSGVVSLPCASATLGTKGTRAWWDDTNQLIVPYVPAVGWYAGTFHAAKVDAETSCEISLNQVPAPGTILTKTADYTLTTADNGAIVSTAGASGTVVISLPAAVPGMRYGGRVGAAQELRFEPNGSETISLPSTGVPGAAGKYLTANAAGETVDLVCVVAGTWSVFGYTGTWTAEA